MKTTVLLEQDDLSHMRDVILEALDIEPTDEQIKEYFEMLPDHIKDLAVTWGTSDTVFQDDMYEWLQENIKRNDDIN